MSRFLRNRTKRYIILYSKIEYLNPASHVWRHKFRMVDTSRFTHTDINMVCIEIFCGLCNKRVEMLMMQMSKNIDFPHQQSDISISYSR